MLTNISLSGLHPAVTEESQAQTKNEISFFGANPARGIYIHAVVVVAFAFMLILMWSITFYTIIFICGIGKGMLGKITRFIGQLKFFRTMKWIYHERSKDKNVSIS